jgi:hypothetical protein
MKKEINQLLARTATPTFEVVSQKPTPARCPLTRLNKGSVVVGIQKAAMNP